MLPQTNESQITELRELDRRATRLSRIKAVLEWDQETNLPPEGVLERSEQLALLEGLIYEAKTSPHLGAITTGLHDATLPSDIDRALVDRLHRDYQRSSKLSLEFAERKARLVGLAQSAWAQARRDSDFKQFAPYLRQLVELARETADRVGYTDEPYDALLVEYEPFSTTQELRQVFDELEPGVSRLTARIKEAPPQDASFLYRRYPREHQEAVVREMMSLLGFDSRAGRLDTTAHPFCTTLGYHDVRITTRWDENFFNMAFFGAIHETGHALYEQGFDPRLAETSLASGTSLGLHESQSRFWENMVARSRPFAEFCFPLLRRHFPEALAGVDGEKFYRAVNRVEPSLIRVEADEVTYTLHILLRFRLETALLDGSLTPDEVPSAWNELSQKLLGVRPENDAEGCLQDIHWAMGGLGYFPTYALGNLYAAQFTGRLRQALPDWDDQLRVGNVAPTLAWLRTNIHRHGAVYPAGELCRRVTGQPLSARPFLEYLNAKYSELYGLSPEV